MGVNDIEIDVRLAKDDGTNINNPIQHNLDPTREAALVRKIDWRIIPTLFLTYFLQFLDKVIINYANVMGMQKDLRMHGQDFSWTATAFFIGYIGAEFPQGVLLQRFSLSKVLGCNVLLWGIILCCSATCKSTASIIAARTLLGMCEAVIAPALTVITSQWYTRTESTLRFGIWYCGLGAGQIVGGLISYGAQHSATRVAGWRIMFICVGVANIFVALLVLFTLPENPRSAKFVSQEEIQIIDFRLKADRTGTDPPVSRMRGVVDSLLDLQTWLLILLTLCITIPSGVITTFSSVLIRSFGFDSKQSALLNIPSGAVSIFATLLSTWAIAKNAPRWLSIIALLIPALLGGALLSFEGVDRQAGSLAGIYLVNFIVAPLAIIFAWAGSNFTDRTQKVTGSAAISAAFGVANIIGPQTYQTRDAPGYLPAKITLMVVIALAILVTMALRALYGHRNRLADQQGSVPPFAAEHLESGRESGETGSECFRYVL